ncbi:MAG TPA: SLC13 family permease [Gammaproteobacteria bacterium]|nr:SLC13 family permease [Gammaproteobacteria bacterium]
MTPEALLTLATVLAVLLALTLSTVGPDLVMIAALTFLLSCGVLDTREALAGFANEGLITVGVLFIVATGLRDTGGMAWLAQRILGRPTRLAAAQARMMIPTALMSSIMNNTPLVAMLVPVVNDWAKKLRMSPSQFMMPLSFATILGGLCTEIGTSTNVVVYGLLREATGEKPGLFAIAPIGLVCAAVGIAYMLLFSRLLLKDRKPAFSLDSDPREYTVEMMVEPGGALAGRTIEEAGLRHLPGAYLIEIERDGDAIVAVGPEQRLKGDDRLIFVGIVDSIVELQRIRGLRPATDQVFKLDAHRDARCLVEAVVSDSCPLVGGTIRDGRFRNVYNAAVIAVARNGRRIKRKIGDIVLEAGDVLLLETHNAFAETQRNSRDFLLVTQLADSAPVRHERAGVAVAILLGMIALAAMEWMTMLNAALVAACLMIATRCVTGQTARRSIDWQVLIVIGAALGIGRALETSGGAQFIVTHVLGLAGHDPFLALVVIYGLTMIFTELMSNNAAAAMMFPLALATAQTLGVSHLPFVFGIMIAASCGFATPIGYQTNLMVYGPGGYQFRDFVVFGGLLNLIVWAVAVTVLPLVYGF